MSKEDKIAFNSAIVIVAYNCWDHIFKCLDSIAFQTVKPQQVVVVNNGDKPQTQVMEQLLDYPFVSLIEPGENLGFARGCNLGVEYADKADWIALLNPDTELSDNWLEVMRDAVVENPLCVSFGSRLLVAENPSLVDGVGDCYHYSGMAWRKGHMSNKEEVQSAYDVIFSPCAAAALYKRSVYTALGGLDEDFFCYLEDVDLGFRFLLNGYESLNVNNAEVLHVGSVTTVRKSNFYVFYGQRNLIWVYIKNMPLPFLIVFLPFHIFINLLGIIRYALVGKFSVVVKAKVSALKRFFYFWGKRVEIQKGRKVSLMCLFKRFDKSFFPSVSRLLK